MLSDRRQKVLAALIEEYVLRALPVGSRTLVENYSLGVSSATVRNELSVLEDDGYITQPHTSAGRVPTDFGYRTFVDHLLEGELAEEELDDDTKKAVEDLRESATELDDLMDRTAKQLAKLTECLTIVVPPSTLMLDIKQVTFVSLSDTRTLIVVVMQDGQVFNRQVEFSRPVSCDDIGRAQNTVNALLSGKTPAEVEAKIKEGNGQSPTDPLVQLLVGEVLICLKEHGDAHAHSLGLSTLVRQPEFQSPNALVPVLDVLENDTVLLQILEKDVSGSDTSTTVRIGKENGTEKLSGVSVVAGRYGRGASEGVVAVIGPTRMNYAQVIKAVKAAREALNE